MYAQPFRKTKHPLFFAVKSGFFRHAQKPKPSLPCSRQHAWSGFPICTKTQLLSHFWNMKFFKIRIFFTIILFAAISLPAVWAQGNRDFMRETGKINVVVGVVLLIFLGIVWYIFRLERKLTKLEHQLNDDKNEWKN
jgi:CcmD family protein